MHIQVSSLLLAINLNFELEVPKNDDIKLYDNMGYLGNKRIRQGAMQPETSCELLHNWSSAAEDQYWCHNLHPLILGTRCPHYNSGRLQTEWFELSPKWMDSKPSASSHFWIKVTNGSVQATAWIIHTVLPAPETAEVFLISILKNVKKWREIPQTKDRFSGGPI